MKSILKSTTLEKQFPLLSVERGCIVSKDADVTVAYRVTLPELFTVTTAEYESMHGTWLKALKVLPTYTVVHKQDWFTTRRYCPDLERCGSDFLSHGFERHFNERSFLDHCCYLFLTKTTRERMRSQSVFSTLCRSRIVPKEMEDREAVGRFLDAAGQFESIVNESGLIRLERMDTDGILGTGERSGLLDPDTSRCLTRRGPYWKTSVSIRGKCVSGISFSVCTRFPIWTIYRRQSARTAVMNDCPPTVPIVGCRTLLRSGCCSTAITSIINSCSSTITRKRCGCSNVRPRI